MCGLTGFNKIKGLSMLEFDIKCLTCPIRSYAIKSSLVLIDLNKSYDNVVDLLSDFEEKISDYNRKVLFKNDNSRCCKDNSNCSASIG